MNPLLEKLHDIDGLDSVSWWPLAIGWWVIIFVGICALCALIGIIRYWILFKRSWKNDAFQKLAVLEGNLSEATVRETIITLSEYLRRIALRRFPREECAGLIGPAWLKWLTKQDPKNFDWERQGAVLIEVPYAPLNQRLSDQQVKDLIKATREWVR